MLKKYRRLLLPLLVLLAAAGAAALGVSGSMVSATRDRILDRDAAPPEGLDCVLILGCGVRPDGSPSNMLTDRLETGIALYRAGWTDKLLMSGDNSEEHYNEVGAMRRYALAEGVADEDIVLDHAGLCTYDSVYRARDIFGVKRMVIVTQEYHLSRALYIARSLGMEAWGVDAALRPYRGQIVRDVREVLARDKDFLCTLTKPEPKYLGDPIPLRPEGERGGD